MTVYKTIKQDRQIWKFCFYGFFKNLKFFEPYLLIYLIAMGLNLFQIGILISVRGGITYLFEIPSGMIADHYGKKKELLVCFIFYILSFALFFFGSNMLVLSIGMIFYGLGEAFRSGTHKAMVLSYLNHKGWFEHKGYVYGRTRSYSLLGSSLSAFLSILLVLNLPALKWVFLVCIIPYMIDFVLVASYPNYLDEQKDMERTLKVFYLESIRQLKSIGKNRNLQKVLISSASLESVFSVIKDYIQPILSILLMTAGVRLLSGYDNDARLKIFLGILYGIFYIFSSIASKNIHRLSAKFQAVTVFERFFDLMALMLALLALSVQLNYLYVAVGGYFIIYIIRDARRPVFVDLCSDFMTKEQRATVLSIESQIKAFLMVVMAPLFGWIGDRYSIGTLFLSIGIVLIIANRLLRLKHIETVDA